MTNPMFNHREVCHDLMNDQLPQVINGPYTICAWDCLLQSYDAGLSFD
jgi:hypothetical protein